MAEEVEWQRVFEMDSMERPHEYIFVDEAGFNLAKRRRRGWKIIGQHAIVEVPGQHGGNVTLCAAISNGGFSTIMQPLGHITLTIFLHFWVVFRMFCLQDHQQAVHPVYVVVWDNVSFHRGVRIPEWFNINQRFMKVCLPPYSTFLNAIEEFFSAWRWKGYDMANTYTRVNVLQAMELACDDIGVECCQGWIRHTRGFFPRCQGSDNIACDVDEVLWPDLARRQDAKVE
ncbi:uncharacterized protein LOC125140009 [Tachysurus fulvidraco]|uniref:uncharacterized protein LOC125140009 n=1 Tax=Tachysurus fulvidraco TaxID=1234273 RepID=UPI001FEFBE6B|nr:uncharacterized protein LOC125140009 [Tachysurus fulvidraco]